MDDILVIDSDPNDLLFFREQLESSRRNIVTTSCGKECIKLLAYQTFKLILLDLHIPEMDDFKLFSKIKKDKKHTDTPVIILTSHDRNYANAASIFEKGVSDYLLKPIDPNLLQGKVDSIITLFNRQKQIERQLKRQQKQHIHQQALLDNMPDIAWIKDREHQYLAVNKAFLDAFKISSKDIIGKCDEHLVGKQLAEKFRNADDEVLINGRKILFVEPLQDQYGNTSWYETIKTPIINDQGEIFGTIGISRNITTRRQAEIEKENIQAKLSQSAKLASIGELAAGVGHEINNPLTIIIGYLELMSSYMAENKMYDDPRIKKCLNAQENAIQRIANIVKGLRTFVRPDNDLVETISINDCIEKTLAFLQVIYQKEGISIKRNLSKARNLIRGNSGRFQQIIINLLSNAKDATAHQTHRHIEIKTTQLEEHAKIEIIDNGTGIEPAILPKIFDSFFTTKEIGKGTGLGLGIVRNIVEELQGTIDVTSVPDEGSTFTLLIPRI